MKPSEKCKKEGFTLAELARYTGQSEQTLINWSKNKPYLFDTVVHGCARIIQLEKLAENTREFAKSKTF